MIDDGVGPTLFGIPIKVKVDDTLSEGEVRIFGPSPVEFMARHLEADVCRITGIANIDTVRGGHETAIECVTKMLDAYDRLGPVFSSPCFTYLSRRAFKAWRTRVNNAYALAAEARTRVRKRMRRNRRGR